VFRYVLRSSAKRLVQSAPEDGAAKPGRLSPFVAYRATGAILNFTTCTTCAPLNGRDGAGLQSSGLPGVSHSVRAYCVFAM
jgi:hypothetical protein